MGKDFNEFLSKAEVSQNPAGADPSIQGHPHHHGMSHAGGHSQFQMTAAASSRFSPLNSSDSPSNESALSSYGQFQIAQIYAKGFLSILTAPLVTTHVALQLSGLTHRNLFGESIDQDLKAMSKVKDISIADRRKYELLIKSGATGTQLPFRAPAYGGYMDVFRSIANQGLLGFYKGNLMGIMYGVANSSLRFQFVKLLDYSPESFYTKGSNFVRGASVFAVCSLADLICQPIQMIQSRFILQNRLPNFSVYKSVFDLLKKQRKQGLLAMFKGSFGHVMKNGVMGLTWALYDRDNAQRSFIISTIVGHVISYPIFTAMRRIQCQVDLPGMLNTNYTGTLNALKTIGREEGVKGLYRGFIAYAIANTFLNGFAMLSNASHNSQGDD